MILAPTLTLSAGSGAAIVRPTFSRDFAGEKTLNNGTGPAITFTRASNATFFDASGVLQTAANDAPRFDHDPATGASRGLLIEEARTNLLVRSEQFGNASWGTSRASITINAATAPNGTTTADKLVEDTTPLNNHATGQAYNTTNSTITFSVFVKPAGRNFVLVQFTNLVDSAASCFFDIQAGTSSTPFASGADFTQLSSSITTAGNGWFRCSLTCTKGAANSISWPFISIAESITSGTYTGDGTSGLYIWGAQLEAGAFRTSYIPTTTAATTRSADSAVVTPISSFYNQTEGTLFAETLTPATTGGRDIVTFNSDIANNWIGLRWAGNTQAQFAVLADSVAHVSIAASGYTAAGVYKRAGVYKVDDFAQVIDGTVVGTDTSGTLPVVSRLVFASAGNHVTLNGHIRKIAYWPKRLSNTLLQQLTT